MRKPSEESDELRQLASHLREKARENGGECYCKCKFISDELGLSPKQLGVYMGRLQDVRSGLVVEQWGKSRATTWYVSLEQ